MTTTLDQLLPDDSGRIVSVNATATLRRRLATMGVTPGARLIVRKFAPFGDPIEIKIRHYSLSIRRSDAGSVVIDRDERGHAS